MVRRRPPDDCPSPHGPARFILRAGAVVWRIHDRKWAPSSYNGTPHARRRRTGRFDAPDDAYWALYAANDERATFAEALLRDEVVGAPDVRSLPRKQLEGHDLSTIHVKADLDVVSLVGGPNLARIGQDAWLTSCDEDDYPLTQEYATAIRGWAPWAIGMVWAAKRDNLRRAFVLFSDRAPADALEDGDQRPLDDPTDPYPKVMLARLSVSLEDPLP